MATHERSFSSPQQSISCSRLLTIPREVRDQILSYLVTFPIQPLWPNKPYNKFPRSASPPMQLTFLRANKQLYDEGMQALARENKWRLLSVEDINDISRILGPDHVRYAARFEITWSFLIHDRLTYRAWFDPTYERLVIDKLIYELPGIRQVTLDYDNMSEWNSCGHVDFVKNLARRHDRLSAVYIKRMTRDLAKDKLETVKEKDREFVEEVRLIIDERKHENEKLLFGTHVTPETHIPYRNVGVHQLMEHHSTGSTEIQVL